MVGSSTHIEFQHDAHCPDISPVHCAELNNEIDPHVHKQTLTLSQMNTTLGYGLGGGWQLSGMLPFQVKDTTIDYVDMDGKPFDPPYGNIHHRTETLSGVGDANLEVQHYKRLPSDWILGAGLGTTIPLGRTEEDPYALANKGETHQHLQMGSGSFTPIGRFSAMRSGSRWGVFGSINGKLPLYENGHGYQPSAMIQGQIGPTLRAHSKVLLLATISGTHLGPATWASLPDPTSGRSAMLSGLSTMLQFTPSLSGMIQGQMTLAQWSREDQILQRFIGTVGISFTPKAKADHGHPR